MLKTFTLQTFTPLVGSQFDLSGPDGKALVLELLEANVAGSAAPSAIREPFSLTFCEPSAAPLDQRTYELTHPSLGTFQLFIVPVGRDQCGTRYEAVFG